MSSAPAANPYAAHVGHHDPLALLGDTPRRIAAVVRGFDEAAFARSYAPGKWSARQLLVHLAQTELMFQARVRQALITPGYAITPFEQDGLLALEAESSGPAALACYLGLREFSLPLIGRLNAEQLDRTCPHPERGAVRVRDILATLAGHERLHAQHLEMVAGVRSAVSTAE